MSPSVARGLVLIIYIVYIQCVHGITRPTAIKLKDNEYTKVLMAIHHDVTENTAVLDTLKDMITKGSNFMYTATRKRAYFKEVTILIPPTWTGSYEAASSEVYTNADVVVEKANTRYHDNPFTRSYSGCGRAGIRVYLTEGFMTMDSRTLGRTFGPREKVLVHEWAHFRWGVFDEYAQEGEQNFYFSPTTGAMEGVRCNIEIYGRRFFKFPNGTIFFCLKLDPTTGRYPDDCEYLPDARRTSAKSSIMDRSFLRSITDFCDDDQSDPAKVHNSEAPNKQNRMCGQRSTWAVISDTDDFKGGKNPPRDVADTTPTIRVVKAAAKRRVALVLDTSGSMMNDEKLTRLRQTASNFIVNGVDDDADIGVVAFSDRATVISPMSPLQNHTVRLDLKRSLPRRAGGGTSVGAGVQKALEVLTAGGKNASGSVIVLLTDGKETVPPFLHTVLPSVRQAGAIVSIMAFNSDPDDNFAASATGTGGHFYYDSNQPTSTSMDDALFDIYTTYRHDRSDNAVQLLSRAKGLYKGESLSGKVNVDVDIGKDTHFMLAYLDSEPHVTIISPTGRIYNKVYPEYSGDADFKTIKVAIPEIAESGEWTYLITNNKSAYQKVSIMAVSRPVDIRRTPIKVFTSIVSENNTWPTEVIIYAEVTKSFHAVTGLTVEAVIERPFAKPYSMVLLDNGAGGDTTKDDGVYSRYFTKFTGNGRYSVRIDVTGTGVVKQYHPPDLTFMNSKEHRRRRSTVHTFSTVVSRVSTGGVFEINHPNMTSSFQPFNIAMLEKDLLAPVRITDLTVMKTSQRASTVVLSWTAPGDDIDHYTAERYQILMAPRVYDLIHGYTTVRHISQKEIIFGNLGSPKPAGSREIFVLKLNVPPYSNTSFVFTIRATDEVGNWGCYSNYATGGFGFVPDYVAPDYTAPLIEGAKPAGPSDSQKLVIAGVVGSLAVLLVLVIFLSFVLYNCHKQPVRNKKKSGLV